MCACVLGTVLVLHIRHVDRFQTQASRRHPERSQQVFAQFFCLSKLMSKVHSNALHWISVSHCPSRDTSVRPIAATQRIRPLLVRLLDPVHSRVNELGLASHLTRNRSFRGRKRRRRICFQVPAKTFIYAWF